MNTQTELHNAAAALGRLGGLKRTEAKSAAARRNGRLGGRPRKPAPTPEPVQPQTPEGK